MTMTDVAGWPRQALILAGGAGTRLQPLVSDVPKPMAPIAGRPFLEYLVAQAARAGIAEIVMCVGYKAEAIEGHFGGGGAFGVRIRYSREHEALGTAGALKLAEALLVGDRWLVLNGDLLFDIPIVELIARHVESEAQATLALARASGLGRYGAVALAAGGSVTSFVEKPDISAPHFINGGLYMIERSTLHRIPADRPVSLEREVLPALVGGGLRGEPFDGYFVDIGVPADYLRAQSEAERFSLLISAPH